MLKGWVGHQKMITLASKETIKELLNVANETPEGSFAEVGVYQGGTAYYLSLLAEKQKRNIYLYDTFSGIPYKDEIDQHDVGDFKDTSYKEVKNLIPYAKVIQGIFPESAVEMGKIAFVHIDCDQYRSIVESVEYLKPKMIKGGVMWFDDYGCLEGATKAVHDLFGNNIEIISNKAVVKF